MGTVTDIALDQQGESYAAVDLGSNSFHMVIVRVANGNVQIIGKIKQKVRLAAGLDEQLALSEESMQRGWHCLQSFAERLQDIPASNVRIVATATLRLATNAGAFLKQAEKILGHRVSVISGEEEARQIYLGVAYTSANQGNTLVVDIGGASTEIIIGRDMIPIHLCSLDMGCVTFMERYFPHGELCRDNFDNAKLAAHSLLDAVGDSFMCFDWQQCLGASGTPQAIVEILVARQVNDAIRLDYLHQLIDECIQAQSVDKLNLVGLEESRRAIFASGLAILTAIFERLCIRQMNISGGALREGLIYGMLDSNQHTDRRQQTLNLLCRKFHIDRHHADNVRQLAQKLLVQLCAQTQMCHFDSEAVLEAAAMLHELGLHIEYKKYHEHGSYIVNHIELPGFTRLQRDAIRDLIRYHRLAVSGDVLALYHDEVRPMLECLLRILRIAVVLGLRRNKQHNPSVQLLVEDDRTTWTLVFPSGWLKAHPLIDAELANECWLQHRAGWKLLCQ